MPKVIKTGVRAIKGTLGGLESQAEKLVAHRHVQLAARTRSSLNGALGLAKHEPETEEAVI
jgi:hypothetical protein